MVEDEEFLLLQSIVLTKGYELLRPIGQGSFAKVFVVKSLKYNDLFVLKRIDKTKISKNLEANDCSEIRIMSKLSHPNILSMYDFFFDEKFIYLILEYCQKGSLQQYINENGSISERILFPLCKGIIEGLYYVHSLGIAHRDLKPSNILIDSYGRPKIADFGLCAEFSENELANNFLGSLPYMSPEIINKTQYNPFLADIWALGVTFFTMTTSSLPWSTKSKDHMQSAIKFGIIGYKSIKNIEFRSLLIGMLQTSPRLRTSLEIIKKNPLFNNKSSTSSTPSILSINSFINKPIIRSNKRLINNNNNNLPKSIYLFNRNSQIMYINSN